MTEQTRIDGVPGFRARRGAAPRNDRVERNTLLIAIARRERTERLKRGVTRKVLAGHCQVSERYLSQVELGEGNPSVLVLDSIARALDLDPVDLLPPGRTRASLLKTPPNRARRIALIGLRGAGKSTLGHALAQRLAAPFIEL